MILHQSTPQHYGRWLRGIVGQFVSYSAEEDLVFVNAWNEWGEGAHLEPDQKWGRAYLEAHLGLYDAPTLRP
jgi:lipopolysaccharide biosynthesis protein